jgi:DNA phosphorothioation-associated putative methyltransferase
VLDKEGRLKPKASIANPEPPLPPNGKVKVERHLTAIDWDKLSAPMQALARHNYLAGNYSVFDYGCGKGDDVRELEAHGLDVSFWDPVYHSDGVKQRAEIVNLGYVINVIEDRKERDQVLRDAFKFAEKILAVSAMLAGDATIGQFAPY